MWFKRIKSSIYAGQTLSTRNIVQDVDPALWFEHRFGLSQSRWNRLKGGAFWITGAGTGYGRAIAVALTAAGARTFITGRRMKMLEATRAEAMSFGINVDHCNPIVADISSENEITAAILSIAQHSSNLSGLVNCAAIPQPETYKFPLSELHTYDWINLMKTNITAQWLVTKSALPLLLTGDSARVIFFSSEAGWSNTPGFGPYNISKSALNTLGASLAAECNAKYPKKDIQINVLDPGEASTEMNKMSGNSPYSVVSMVLALLSHPEEGPNGHFFHRDGRHLTFGNNVKYNKELLISD